MKKVAAILFSIGLSTVAFAQGLVSFGNGPTTQISATVNGNTAAIAAGNAGAYYFGLLTSPSGAAGSFTFMGVYATNSAAAGRIAPHTAAVPGWAPGTSMFYEVAGWSASLGTTFSPNWLIGFFDKPGNFGLSSVATGTAGGGSPVPAPAWNLFGGSGLAGFNIYTPLTPEPSSIALAGFGAAAMLALRRRK